MSYSSCNHLRKIIDIQNITLEYKAKGCTQEWIYQKLIKPTYNIGRSTYYKYLRRAAKSEIKKINLVL
jgi:hypothetical protein